MKPIYIILIICLIVIVILLFLRWLVMRIYKKHIFSSSPSYTSRVKSNSLILKDDNSPQSFLWSHEYSNNFDNDPTKEKVRFSLSRDLMSPGEITFSLSVITHTIITDRITGEITIRDFTLRYECINVPCDWDGTSINFDPKFGLSCTPTPGAYINMKLVSINYVPSTINGLRNDSFNITFEYDRLFVRDGEKSKKILTYVCMANLSSPIMGPISDSLNTFLKTAISNTLIKLPTLTNSQIGDNTYWQATSNKSNLGACFGGHAIDNRLILRDIYQMSFGNFTVQDIQLFYSPETIDTGTVDQFGNKITKDLYTCSAKLHYDGDMNINTSGFAIQPLCRFGFNAGPLDFMNPVQEHDEWKGDDTFCYKASVKASFDDGDPLPTIDIQFKVNLDNYPLVVIDHFSSVKFVKKIVALKSVFSDCDSNNDSLYMVAHKFAKLDNLVKDAVNNLITDGAVDKVLIDLLNQNKTSINDLIKTNTPSIGV